MLLLLAYQSMQVVSAKLSLNKYGNLVAFFFLFCEEMAAVVHGLLSMDKLTSRIIREKLKETFHADFSAHKAIIDKITMEVVEDGEKGEEQEKSEATDEGEAAAKTGESSSESDNVFTDRAPRKRAGASRKGAKVRIIRTLLSLFIEKNE
ncbi:unnamed protein product [Gongylonema pulchrum]|uniref:DEK_C domain-containing protein n=1 Tax=Gongylonema pulchrum TaxID=637853 RepID=A0A183EQX7_9BILA|nr:unnamed protein product [Gongylonema pulchrum]